MNKVIKMKIIKSSLNPSISLKMGSAGNRTPDLSYPKRESYH